MRIEFVVALFAFIAREAHSTPTPLPNFEENCIGLRNKIALNHTYSINLLKYLKPNDYVNGPEEGINDSCKEALAAPIAASVCRLSLRVKTTETSEVEMEIWLPEKWESRRVLTTGNSALSGCIRYTDLAYGASYGFATIGTNAGHNGSSGRVFYDHPEVYEDFIWRGVQTGTTIGKSIAQQFYGEISAKSYYMGCSTGGRQAWTAIQRTPSLFDGVLAGAPANGWFAHIAWFANALKILGFTANETAVTPDQWAAVKSEVLRQCDGLDGARDGILEDPIACKLDWTPLLCSPATTGGNYTCITQEQVNIAASLFEPVEYNNTTLLSPGHGHGYETEFINALYTPFITDLLTEVFRYIVYKNLSWDLTTYTLQDSLNALQINPSNLDSFDGDISEFRDRGGKVVHWHGIADDLTSFKVSDWYYKTVQSALNTSVADLDKFYRYFRVSGVGHCYGGPGANFMGQLGGAVAGNDPDENMLMGLVQWVEENEAPETVGGKKFVNDSLSLGLEFKRRHCKYPRVNKLKGGDWKDERAWECVDPVEGARGD